MVHERERRCAPERRGERGQVLVLFVLASAVLMGMVALAIDVGIILHQRRELQNTVDAAALAGAVELPDSAVLAESEAMDWAQRNGIETESGDTIQISVSDDHTAVTVEVHRDTPFIFARVLGLGSVDVGASATAKVGSPSDVAGLLPFGVLESAVNSDGSPTTLKYDATDPTNGNFGALAIDGTGANIHGETIKYGSDTAICSIAMPDCVDPSADTQTGNLIGKTRDGFNYLLDITSDQCDEIDEVLLSDGDGGYVINSTCSPWIDDRESGLLVLIPVIDAFPNGASAAVTIADVAAFFITGFGPCTGNDCEITGIFVTNISAPGAEAALGIYDPGSTIKFVRLVD